MTERSSPRGNQWHFAIPPIALAVAVVVAAVASEPNRFVWGGWTLFMMASSLALAYGLVYRGIYADAAFWIYTLQKREARLIEIQKPPEDNAVDVERAVAALIERYRVERSWIEQVARAKRLGLRLGDRKAERRRGKADGASAAAIESHAGVFGRARDVLIRVLSKVHLTRGRTVEPPDPEQWDVIDLEIAREHVDEIAKLRVERARIQAEVGELERELTESAAVASLTALRDIRTQRANLAGAIAQSEAKDRASQELTSKAETELIQRIRAVIAAATRLRAPFDEIAAEAGAPVSHEAPSPPGPTVLADA